MPIFPKNNFNSFSSFQDLFENLPALVRDEALSSQEKCTLLNDHVHLLQLHKENMTPDDYISLLYYTAQIWEKFIYQQDVDTPSFQIALLQLGQKIKMDLAKLTTEKFSQFLWGFAIWQFHTAANVDKNVFYWQINNLLSTEINNKLLLVNLLGGVVNLIDSNELQKEAELKVMITGLVKKLLTNSDFLREGEEVSLHLKLINYLSYLLYFLDFSSAEMDELFLKIKFHYYYTLVKNNPRWEYTCYHFLALLHAIPNKYQKIKESYLLNSQYQPPESDPSKTAQTIINYLKKLFIEKDYTFFVEHFINGCPNRLDLVIQNNKTLIQCALEINGPSHYDLNVDLGFERWKSLLHGQIAEQILHKIKGAFFKFSLREKSWWQQLSTLAMQVLEFFNEQKNKNFYQFSAKMPRISFQDNQYVVIRFPGLDPLKKEEFEQLFFYPETVKKYRNLFKFIFFSSLTTDVEEFEAAFEYLDFFENESKKYFTKIEDVLIVDINTDNHFIIQQTLGLGKNFFLYDLKQPFSHENQRFETIKYAWLGLLLFKNKVESSFFNRCCEHVLDDKDNDSLKTYVLSGDFNKEYIFPCEKIAEDISKVNEKINKLVNELFLSITHFEIKKDSLNFCEMSFTILLLSYLIRKYSCLIYSHPSLSAERKHFYKRCVELSKENVIAIFQEFYENSEKGFLSELIEEFKKAYENLLEVNSWNPASHDHVVLKNTPTSNQVLKNLNSGSSSTSSSPEASPALSERLSSNFSSVPTIISNGNNEKQTLINLIYQLLSDANIDRKKIIKSLEEQKDVSIETLRFLTRTGNGNALAWIFNHEQFVSRINLYHVIVTERYFDDFFAVKLFYDSITQQDQELLSTQKNYFDEFLVFIEFIKEFKLESLKKDIKEKLFLGVRLNLKEKYFYGKGATINFDQKVKEIVTWVNENPEMNLNDIRYEDFSELRKKVACIKKSKAQKQAAEEAAAKIEAELKEKERQKLENEEKHLLWVMQEQIKAQEAREAEKIAKAEAKLKAQAEALKKAKLAKRKEKREMKKGKDALENNANKTDSEQKNHPSENKNKKNDSSKDVEYMRWMLMITAALAISGGFFMGFRQEVDNLSKAIKPQDGVNDSLPDFLNNIVASKFQDNKLNIKYEQIKPNINEALNEMSNNISFFEGMPEIQRQEVQKIINDALKEEGTNSNILLALMHMKNPIKISISDHYIQGNRANQIFLPWNKEYASDIIKFHFELNKMELLLADNMLNMDSSTFNQALNEYIKYLDQPESFECKTQPLLIRKDDLVRMPTNSFYDFKKYCHKNSKGSKEIYVVESSNYEEMIKQHPSWFYDMFIVLEENTDTVLVAQGKNSKEAHEKFKMELESSKKSDPHFFKMTMLCRWEVFPRALQIEALPTYIKWREKQYKNLLKKILKNYILPQPQEQRTELLTHLFKIKKNQHLESQCKKYSFTPKTSSKAQMMLQNKAYQR